MAKEIKFTNVSMAKRWSLTESQCEVILNKLLDIKCIKVDFSNSAYTTYEVIQNPYE